MSLRDTTSECPIYKNGVRNPGGIAIQSGSNRVSYLRLDAMVGHCTTRLRYLGVGKGTLVGVYAAPSQWYIALLFALFRLGAVAVPLNTRFPLETIPGILATIQCSWLVSDNPSFMQSPSMQLTLVKIEDFIANELKQPVTIPGIAYEQPVTVIFSSGSTGSPRAVLHSWGNHWYSALGSNLNISLNPGDRWLLSLPLFHVAGIAVLFRSFLAGSTVVIPAPDKRVEQNIHDFNITHASLVATQLKRVLEQHPHRAGWDPVKAFLVGGSAVPKTLIEQALERGVPLFLSYGLSEMASQVATTPPGAPIEGYTSSGKVLPHREIMISPDGEICVRGKTLFLGYLEKKFLNKPFDSEGWFRTGDLGSINSEGWLTVRGRKDSMFISGGENIYPEHIERVLERHTAIQRSLVVPVEDDEFGKRPVAFVDTGDQKITIEQINSFLEGVLPRYMYPIAYIPWCEAPGRDGIKDSRLAFMQKANTYMRLSQNASKSSSTD